MSRSIASMPPEAPASDRGSHARLAFVASGEPWVVPSAWVRELVELDQVTRLPGLPPEVEGFATSNGRPLPLLVAGSRAESSTTSASAASEGRRRALHVVADAVEFLFPCERALGPTEVAHAARELPIPATAASRGSAGPVVPDVDTMVLMLERAGRLLAVEAGSVVAVLAFAPDAREVPSLDVWLGDESAGSETQRALQLVDGQVLRTCASIRVEPDVCALTHPVPAWLASWASRQGVKALLVRGTGVGVCLDPVAWSAAARLRAGA